MIFKMARCETCLQYVDDIRQLVAYRLKYTGPEPVDLKGQEPWSGVRVVCLPCVRFLAGRAGPATTRFVATVKLELETDQDCSAGYIEVPRDDAAAFVAEHEPAKEGP
jgi:hypothetical protein